MKEYQSLLLSLARDSYHSSALLRDAIEHDCQTCISDISDINRHALLELGDLEHRFLRKREREVLPFLHTAHAFRRSITQAFSAAMLIWDGMPYLPPLVEIAVANTQLASYPVLLLEKGANALLQAGSPHLCANKGRGAHALLVSNVCPKDTSGRLLPLALATEAHRNALEAAYEVLITME